MPSISILLPDLRGGGVERVRLSIAREFTARGHDVQFVLMDARGELLEEGRSQFAVTSLNTPRMRQLPRTLARHLREHRPDALMAAMWPLTVLAPVAQHLSGHRCRTVVSEHNTLSIQYAPRGQLHNRTMRASMAVGYRLADAVVGVSAGVVEDLRRLSGVDDGRFHVIYNPVPPRAAAPSRLSRAAVEARWAGAPPGQRILTVGSLKAQKNQALLLRAFARLNRLDAKVMLLGVGQCEADLRQLAAELGIVDRVLFGGFVSDPTPFYESADVFVLSSDYEGFGNVIVEALAAGVRVVSTDCPSGPREILDDGKYGHLVPLRDEAQLARAIEQSLCKPVDRDALIRRSREFTVEKTAAQYLDLLFPERPSR